MRANNRCRLAFFIPLLGLSASVFSGINDPTKPIFSETSSERIVTAPVIKKKKVAFLQSVFYGQKNRSAVINGNIVKEGESVDDLLLKNIYKRYVVLEYKENVIKLFLFKKIYIDKVTGDVSD
jgi:hypothetical protein